MPRVTVVIPTHDRRAMVREAAASVLAQTYRDFELIVVDDGSIDGTAAALQAELDDDLRVIEQTNRGVAAARNAGVAAGSGELIAFLDSDDLWKPQKLTRQVAAIDADPGLSINQTEEIWLRGGTRVNPRRRHAKPEGDIFVASLALCLVSPSAVLLRRDVFESASGFDESLPACEDYDLWLRLARDHRFGLVPEPLVVRRAGHADQLSRRHWGMDRFRVEALTKLLEGPLSQERRAAVAETLRAKCAILAAGAVKRGRGEEAARYMELVKRMDGGGRA